MLRFPNYGLFRNLSTCLRRKININVTAHHPRSFISKGSKILLGSHICCAALTTKERTNINVEDGLIKACEEGDSAIILLMDRLKEFVIVVCREYRDCLTKQIEITEIALNVGPLSEIWDELPQYRTLADELNKELNEYMTVFNTIGHMANDNTLETFVTGSSDQLSLVAIKYKELDTILQKEFAHNKEIELQLLKIKRDSILKDVN